MLWKRTFHDGATNIAVDRDPEITPELWSDNCSRWYPGHMRIPFHIARWLAGGVFVLAAVIPAVAQSKRTLFCTEDVSYRLRDPTPEDPSKIAPIPILKFSLAWNREFLNLITAGRTEFYECQQVTPRLNEGQPRNTVKCQNSVYFLVIDLAGLSFVRAQLNPQSRSDIEVSHGFCRAL